MILSPKTTRRLVMGGILTIGVLGVSTILLAMALATSGAALHVETARDFARATRKTCTKYSESVTVVRERAMHKSEMYRCPDGRLIVLQS